MWYPIVSWGNHWYESNNQWEVLMEDVEDIELRIESLVQGNVRTETLSLDGFPKRAEYSMRLQLETLFLMKKHAEFRKGCRIWRFFPATDFHAEKTIHLGGNDGKFNSLS